MGLRTTAEEARVALLDSVTGVALACEVFNSQEQAEDFIEWATPRSGQPDLRLCSQAELGDLHDRWFDERVDASTGLLRDGPRAGA